MVDKGTDISISLPFSSQSVTISWLEVIEIRTSGTIYPCRRLFNSFSVINLSAYMITINGRRYSMSKCNLTIKFRLKNEIEVTMNVLICTASMLN